ncbi:MAG: AI-2E family transporter [Candidatus Magasanikbacteria bacterium]|jgi:predicted PurR-regulated permease PerM|nr:AI-2E family transporter [Candidatus Magasanikbacteria bacterium]
MKESISFARMQSGFFVGTIILLGLMALYLLRPFAYPIFWAAVVAVMFYPLYLWIDKHIKIKSASAAITVLLVIVLLFMPLILLSLLLVQESAVLYTQIASGEMFGSAAELTTRLQQSFAAPVFDMIQAQWQEYAAGAAKSLSVTIFASVKALTSNSLRFLFLSFLMLYSLFYFLKDGKRMLDRLMHLSPLGDTYEKMLYSRFTSTARATLKSTVIIGGIQGVLGAILFAITGVEGVLIWGVVMTILSIIPAIGSFVVWFPAGVIMLATGSTWQGLTILIVGAVIISNIDNLLRPPLIGKDTQMHPLLVLFSTLGGLMIFGISGFVIGPVLMSLFLAVVTMYDHYYNKELQHN